MFKAKPTLQQQIDSLTIRLHNSRELLQKEWCPMCQTNRWHWAEQLRIDIASAERRLQELEEGLSQITKR